MSVHGWEYFQEKCAEELASLSEQNLLRRLNPRAPSLDSPKIDGIIDLSHNDYLGFRASSKFRKEILEGISQLPVGSGGSRLLGGEHPIFQDLERQFANFKGAESALFFGSGYSANLALGSILNFKNARVFSDAKNHASIIDGLCLAKLSKERKNIFPTRNVEELERQLKKSNSLANFVVTESLFSMDGDKASLKQLLDLCHAYRGILIVDEAHALGVEGKHGEGLLETGSGYENVISVNPCGKAAGVQGGFICGPTWLRDYLINKARPFIYATAPSPWLAHALSISIEKMRGAHNERSILRASATYLRESLRKLGFQISRDNSQIIPVIFGDEERTLRVAKYLFEKRIYCPAIRYPTVARHDARLRISLNATLELGHLQEIIDAFTEVRRLRIA